VCGPVRLRRQVIPLATLGADASVSPPQVQGSAAIDAARASIGYAFMARVCRRRRINGHLAYVPCRK
jgi:hypothetical protein